MSKVIANVIGAVIATALSSLAVPISVLYAWAASVLLRWFDAPQALQALGVVRLAGLSLAAWVLFPRQRVKTENKGLAFEITLAVMVPFMGLFMGWVLRFFK